MNRLVSHFSKTLALLAIGLLPVQQYLTTTCCCQAGQQRVKQTIAESSTGCCSQGETSCCKGANRSTNSCCADGSSDPKSNPCQCPCGCGKNGAPTAVDPATTGWSSEDELPQSAPQSIAVIAGDTTPPNSTSNADAVSYLSARGSQRCAQLCRFLL